jgi:hypothetical protein
VRSKITIALELKTNKKRVLFLKMSFESNPAYNHKALILSIYHNTGFFFAFKKTINQLTQNSNLLLE